MTEATSGNPSTSNASSQCADLEKAVRTYGGSWDTDRACAPCATRGTTRRRSTPAESSAISPRRASCSRPRTGPSGTPPQRGKPTEVPEGDHAVRSTAGCRRPAASHPPRS
ncbi:hypothetical protein ACR6C2_40880 [Streptomyces sp. INA 01156]